ncbi:hypothetical protein [Haloterrigena sp. H1]|nr:hypothetical protein [Haloterrigena sp. H1]
MSLESVGKELSISQTREGFELQLALPARFAAREVPATSRSLTLA